MNGSIRTRAHAAATQGDIHDLVRTLNKNVGPTIVQTIAGVKDRTLPSKWAKADGPTPRQDAQRRLRLGYQAWWTVSSAQGPSVALAWLVGANPMLDENLPLRWWTVSSAQGPSVALAWLVGANPMLDENLPLRYIVDERAADVLGAAVAFVEDVHAA